MSPTFFRQCIAYLLIALLPLQAAAASRLAVCAEMSAAEMGTTKMDAAPTQAMGNSEHCAQMASMPKPESTDKSTPHTSSCWLGSMCLAGMMVLALPASYAGVQFERDTPQHLPQPELYRSIIAESPLRPPTVL